MKLAMHGYKSVNVILTEMNILKRENVFLIFWDRRVNVILTQGKGSGRGLVTQTVEGPFSAVSKLIFATNVDYPGCRGDAQPLGEAPRAGPTDGPGLCAILPSIGIVPMHAVLSSIP